MKGKTSLQKQRTVFYGKLYDHFTHEWIHELDTEPDTQLSLWPQNLSMLATDVEAELTQTGDPDPRLLEPLGMEIKSAWQPASPARALKVPPPEPGWKER